MIKRLAATAGTALAVLVGTVGLSAPAAQAAGTCTLSVPAKVSLWHRYQALTTRASGECVTAYLKPAGWMPASGQWSLIHPTLGYIKGTSFEAPTSTDEIDVYWDFPLGKSTWHPSGAWASGGIALTQNTMYTEFRVGAWAETTASRSGSKVTLSTRAMRFSTKMEMAIPWAGAVGQIQYRVPGTTTWLPLKAVTTYSNGTYTYRYTTTQARDYRTVYVGTPTIWNYTSATVRK